MIKYTKELWAFVKECKEEWHARRYHQKLIKEYVKSLEGHKSRFPLCDSLLEMALGQHTPLSFKDRVVLKLPTDFDAQVAKYIAHPDDNKGAELKMPSMVVTKKNT